MVQSLIFIGTLAFIRRWEARGCGAEDDEAGGGGVGRPLQGC